MNLSIYVLCLGILALIVSCTSYESKLRARAEAGEAEAQDQLAATMRQVVAMEMDRHQVVEAQRLAVEQSKAQ